jgi:hypothetical protein
MKPSAEPQHRKRPIEANQSGGGWLQKTEKVKTKRRRGRVELPNRSAVYIHIAQAPSPFVLDVFNITPRSALLFFPFFFSPFSLTQTRVLAVTGRTLAYCG